MFRSWCRRRLFFKQTASEIQSTFGSSVKVICRMQGRPVVSLPSVYGRSVTAGKPSYMKGIAVTDETKFRCFCFDSFLFRICGISWIIRVSTVTILM